MEKIVNFCPNGSEPTKENSFAPIFPNEIIEDVCKAYDNHLITLVHVHARDKNGKPSSKAEDFAPIIEGIKKYCPDLAICASLSGRYNNTFEARSEVLKLNPDMGSLTMGSWNYKNGVNINTPDMIIKLAHKMNELNIVPELECFDQGMLNYTNYLIKKEVLKKPYYINMIFGNLSNAQIDLQTVNYIIKNKPINSIICFGGIGLHQFKAINYGINKANGVRVGLEDNLYLKNKNKATNLELLGIVKTQLNKKNCKILSPKEFKNIICYK